MSNFSATHAAHSSNFPNAEWREIIVKHEFLGIFLEKSFYILLITFSTESYRGKTLGFTSSEQSGAMCPGHNPKINGYIPNLFCISTIQPYTFFKDTFTHKIFFKVMYDPAYNFILLRIFFSQIFRNRLYQFLVLCTSFFLCKD